MQPYLVMAVLYLTMAGLVALASSLNSFDLLPWFSGLRWLRVHLITLGALTEAVYGILPVLVAKHSNLKEPRLRWDIWLALTTGLLVLMVGIPLVNYLLIVTGGTLVFIATLLLIGALRGLTPAQTSSAERTMQGRPFYLAGMSFFLVGIIVGSGMWFGWGAALRIATPIEVHIHANTWGFMSLVLAGLVIDLYPRWTSRPLAWPGSIRIIFGLMTLGALGAVLGPWLALNWITVPGILLHQTATVWLLLNMIRPLRGAEAARKPGIWHVITAYAWQLIIVLAAPLIFILAPGIPPARIEQTAPQVLIYAWMLQFGYAVLPYLLSQAVRPQQEPDLGGSWFSLAAAHLGGIFLGASILVAGFSAPLLGIAYLLWFLSLLPVTRQAWKILNASA